MARHPDPPRRVALSGRRGPPAQRGIALILVLWVIALLVIMAVGVTADQRTVTSLTANQLGAARFRALNDAAISYAMLRLTSFVPLDEQQDADPAASAWIPDGSPNRWQFDGQDLTVSVQNEGSLLDLNQVSKELLSNLLAALGLPPEEVDPITDAVLDWRDSDDLRLLNGAEDPDYAAAGRPHGAKDAPFDSVEELQQVLGFDRELFLRVAPVLTVSTGAGPDAPELAPPLVQAALEGIALEEIERRIAERAEGAIDSETPLRPISRGGPLYRVRVTLGGPASGRGQQTMETLVEVNPAAVDPFRVLWRNRVPPPAPPTPEAETL